jgi:FkbM family methyltransferase
MNNGSTPLNLAGKAWPFLRRGDFHGLWCAARQRRMVAKWRRDDAENTLRFDYPLTCESTVFDIGGYRGCFIREIVARYDPHVYVFEPVPEFCEQLVKEFRENPKVKICNYGLSNVDSISQMMLAGDGSTIYMTGDMQTTVRLRDIQTVVQELGINRIDLIKINIEGGEYVLLRRMLETELVSICQDIQVQFHRFYPNSQRLRSEIRSALQETHFITYDYPFVWENWRKRPASPTHHHGPLGGRRTAGKRGSGTLRGASLLKMFRSNSERA